MKKIKILRIIARLNIGGPAIHTILLTDGLDKNKFDSLLVSGNICENEGDMYYYAIEKNINPIFVSELNRKLNFFRDSISFVKIYKIIEKEKPDIIHTHTAKAGAIGRMAGIVYNFFNPSRRIKLVHTFHGHIFEGYFGKIKTKIFILIEKFLAKFSAKIITVSEEVKKELVSLEISRENKIELIPLGFELEKFLRIPIRNDNSIFNVGIVGRLVPIKNHRLFLDAAAKMIKDNSDIKIRFKIIGDGELRQELQDYVRKLDIGFLVDFLGWQKDLARIYSDLDIVALTSINEGTPLSLIEAMASGRAVVATDVGGVRDLLGNEILTAEKQTKNFKILERGIIVPSQDSDAFSAALSYILENNSLRKDISLRARSFAKDKFTKERLLRDMESLYIQLLNYENSFLRLSQSPQK
jgi:glycosyltransferase involved in cell wall biosynthesis